MGWFQKQRFGAPEMAEMLHQMLALDEHESLAAARFEVPSANDHAFQEWARLYREAVILMALVEQGPDGPVKPLLKSYEAILFGTDPADMVAYERAVATKNAMTELANIMADDHQYPDIAWARGWLQRTGYDEIDVIKLSKFVFAWIGLFIVARNSVSDMLAQAAKG